MAADHAIVAQGKKELKKCPLLLRAWEETYINTKLESLTKKEMTMKQMLTQLSLVPETSLLITYDELIHLKSAKR